MKATLVGILASLIPITAARAANWVEYGHTTSGARVYVDSQSLGTLLGPSVSALEVIPVSPSPVPHDATLMGTQGLAAAGMFDEEDVYALYQCMPISEETVAIYYYDRGHLVAVEGNATGAAGFSPVLPGGRDYPAIQYVCGKLNE